MIFSRRLWAVTASLALLAACGEATPPTSNTPLSSSTSPAASPMANNSHSMGHSKPININNAILSELDKLEAKLGIPALSNQIQASRPYGSTEELVSKKVLTQAQFDQIKDMVTIEDVVLEGEAKDVDYITKLGLMKGHLIVAHELLILNKPAQAEPHIGHPVEEIYADVEDQLTERNVPEFKTTLIRLQDLVKAGAKDPAKVKTEFQSSLKSVDQAIAILPETERQNPVFVLKVINGLLDTANSEYGAAIANNKISALIEYQDSRGFVIYAEELYQEIAPALAKTDPKVNAEIKKNLTTLKTVWPSVEAPAKPVKSPTEVTALIKNIEKLTTPLTQKSS
ncbi:helix-hairpin-helix domain-containing protein [Synechocystis sp. LKSZ1]|uniref:helix-hairpin-helix domain-containing protein n=1 Tax=Synechocystis sp. LKSZ1 TaxID=3144951 RepID=UPI00336BB99A